MADQNEVRNKNKGGLYAKINMSVRTANILVAILLAVLVAVTVFIVSNGGFVVDFDTDGGSHIESVKLKYSQTVSGIEDPVKEGYKFKGWYSDPDFTNSWSSDDSVTGSMTLYAKWEK